MWSIYDTLMLVSGIIVAVIAVLPVSGIPAATRLWSGAIGGGLILLSLFLGSLRSFRYPSMVMGGPVIALLVLGAVIADARKRSNPDQAALPSDHSASGPLPAVMEPVAVPQGGDAPLLAEALVLTAAAPVVPLAEAPEADADRDAAWAEVNDPSTSSQRLAEIAGQYPEFGVGMLDHPSLYPALREWIERLPGDL